MYRMMTNEKVASAAASAPTVTTRVTATAAIADFARTVVTSLSRAFNRASIAHELSLLDNRVLADIGVKRTEINRVAEQATRASDEPTVFQAFSRMVFTLTAQPVLRYLHRRNVHDTLTALDDRMLADIGLSRYEISDYVRTLDRHDAEQVPALLAATERDLVAPLRAWNRARATARQLSKLDDRMLVDIGVVRGDIDWLAGEVARKTLAPANRVAANDHSPRAA
jgi:uncharacterized protein YjiS (DUF1127 family)